MNTNISTTPEQGKRLLACGVDLKSADFVWMDDNPPRLALRTEIIEDNNPYIVAVAWSLSALMELLPSSLTSALGNKYHLELSKVRMHNQWEVQWYYRGDRWRPLDKDKKYQKLWDASPIEACVRAIEWLSKNGYKLNEIKQ